METSTVAVTEKRPGCVTLYVVGMAFLLGLPLVIVVLPMLAPRGPAPSANLTGGAITLIFITVWAGVLFLILRGIWRLRNWARNLVILFHMVLIFVGAINLAQDVSVRSIAGYVPIPYLFGGLLGILINVLVVLWFMGRREQFA